MVETAQVIILLHGKAWEVKRLKKCQVLYLSQERVQGLNLTLSRNLSQGLTLGT